MVDDGWLRGFLDRGGSGAVVTVFLPLRGVVSEGSSGRGSAPLARTTAGGAAAGNEDSGAPPPVEALEVLEVFALSAQEVQARQAALLEHRLHVPPSGQQSSGAGGQPEPSGAWLCRGGGGVGWRQGPTHAP